MEEEACIACGRPAEGQWLGTPYCEKCGTKFNQMVNDGSKKMDEEKKVEDVLSPLEDGLNELGDEVEEKATELLDALNLPHKGEKLKPRKAFEKDGD